MAGPRSLRSGSPQSPLSGHTLTGATRWASTRVTRTATANAYTTSGSVSGQGEVVHNDDTSMRVLRLERDPKDERTGVFTSGIVSTFEERKIALYFTGWTHAGENLADALKLRDRGSTTP